MKISSINGHVDVPDAVSVRMSGAFFIVTCLSGTVCYNDQGREVFRVIGHKKTLWEKLKEVWNADSIH